MSRTFDPAAKLEPVLATYPAMACDVNQVPVEPIATTGRLVTPSYTAPLVS